MTQQTRKAIRLNEVERMLYQRTGGISVRELAERFGVSMRTMQRTINDLESDHNVPLETDGRLYKISPESRNRLPAINFNLQEARALYLAVRLFLRHCDERDLDGISALEKLAEVFPQSIANQVRATAEELLARPNDRVESRVSGVSPRHGGNRRR